MTQADAKSRQFICHWFYSNGYSDAHGFAPNGDRYYGDIAKDKMSYHAYADFAKTIPIYIYRRVDPLENEITYPDGRKERCINIKHPDAAELVKTIDGWEYKNTVFSVRPSSGVASLKLHPSSPELLQICGGSPWMIRKS